VYGVAVAARTGVDADILTLGSGEASEHFIVEVYEGLEKGCAGPGIAGVLLCG